MTPGHDPRAEHRAMAVAINCFGGVAKSGIAHSGHCALTNPTQDKVHRSLVHFNLTVDGPTEFKLVA